MMERILAEIDDEISRLQQIRSLLVVSTGRPTTSTGTKERKWKMSAAARKRIAEAQRKRWAKQKAEKRN